MASFQVARVSSSLIARSAFYPCSPIGRGRRFKLSGVRVRIPPRVPFKFFNPIRPGLKPRRWSPQSAKELRLVSATPNLPWDIRACRYISIFTAEPCLASTGKKLQPFGWRFEVKMSGFWKAVQTMKTFPDFAKVQLRQGAGNSHFGKYFSGPYFNWEKACFARRRLSVQSASGPPKFCGNSHSAVLTWISSQSP